MKKHTLIFVLGLLYSISARAQVFTKDTIFYNGPSDKYINFVVLGDGYDSSELSKFHDDVMLLRDSFFNKAPFSLYQNYFNIFSINVISPESGIKHPRTASDCPSLATLPISDPNNYFGTAFDVSGVHRLIYPNDFALIGSVLIDNFPDYDQVIILGNSPEYGGAGGEVASLSTHKLSVEIMLHECGHSFAGLADEYWAGDIYASEKKNMTYKTNAIPEHVKWKRWLDTAGVGIYHHSGTGSASDWYKPHTNCEMQFLEREFCAVCSQGIIEKIHSLVNPIEEFLPANQILDDIDTDLEFKITKLIMPIPNTLKIEWQLDGHTIFADTNAIRVVADSISDKYHTVTAVVSDTTSLIRTELANIKNINKVVWHINKDRVVSVKPVVVSTQYLVYPNPAAEVVNILNEGLNAQDAYRIELYNTLGQIVHSQNCSQSQGHFDISLSVISLPTGTYFVHVVTKNGTDKFKLSVVTD
ncbi:MAG: M64 family metallo-endopeptidase [Bacteroidia bacterium]|nr:M64 family metallo-endopeptidase [Bacteroidia bacterium]